MSPRVSLAVALLAIVSFSDVRGEVDQATPKSTVKAFLQACVDGDEAAVRRLVIDDADHQRAGLALCQFGKTTVALEAACQRKFNTSIRSDGNPKIWLDLPDPHGIDYAKVDQADDRFATVRPDDPKVTYRVQRVGNAWRLDMTDDRVRTPADLRRIAGQSEAVTPKLAKLTESIDKGEVATVAAARNVFFAALFDTLQPTTKPAAK